MSYMLLIAVNCCRGTSTLNTRALDFIVQCVFNKNNYTVHRYITVHNEALLIAVLQALQFHSSEKNLEEENVENV